MKKAMINYIQRDKYDEFWTPEYAIKPLLKYLEHFPKSIKIWECTDYGSSNITKVLRENGYTVIATKKEDFNFLTDNADFDFDMIITNPPFSLKDEFLEKCYSYGKPFCLLLPITSLEGINRGKMFREFGIDVIVFDKRISFMKDMGLKEKDGNWFNSSWFCWKALKNEFDPYLYQPENVGNKLIFEELEKK